MFSNKTFLTVFFLFCLEKSVLRGMYRSIQVLYVYPCRGDPWPKTCIPPFLYTTQIHARPTSFKCRAARTTEEELEGGGLCAFLYSRHTHFFLAKVHRGLLHVVLLYWSPARGEGTLYSCCSCPKKMAKFADFRTEKTNAKGVNSPYDTLWHGHESSNLNVPFPIFPAKRGEGEKKFSETEKSYWGDWQEDEKKEKEEERESRKCVFPQWKIQGIQYRFFTTFTTQSFVVKFPLLWVYCM